MKNIQLSIIAIALSSIVLSCCPMLSVNPLSKPSTVEKKLEGVWKLDSKDGEKAYLHISSVSKEKMLALNVEYKGSGDIETLKIPFHLTKINHNLFVNVNIDDLDEKLSMEKSGYIFCKILLLNKDSLIIAFLDEKKVISAIESKVLKGDLSFKKTVANSTEMNKPMPHQSKKVECVTINDSSERIRKFIDSKKNDQIFHDAVKFIRIE